MVTFSYGELSHPHLKREVIIKERVKESKKSDEILGSSSIYFGLSEGKFIEHKEKTKEKIKKMIMEKMPEKIFSHSPEDPHPDHRAVFMLVTEVFDSLDENFKNKCSVYSFPVWNLFNLYRRSNPQLIVNINRTFKDKIRAIKAHKSQRMTIIALIFTIFFRAMFSGMKNNMKYAEVFSKER